MRMVFISGEYPPNVGGVADYTSHLAHAFADLGHEASVLTSAAGRAAAGQARCGDVRVHPVAGRWRVADAASTVRAVRALRPDAINFQYVPQMYGRAGVAPGAAMLPLILRGTCDATVTCTMHEIASPWEPRPGRLAAALAHRVQALLMLSACDRVIVTNALYARRVERWTRGRRRVCEIPVGASILPSSISDAEIAGLRASLGAGEGALIGEMSPLAVGKRPRDLIALSRALGQRARLVMLGGLAADAGRRQAFMRCAAAAGVAERIIWTGVLPPADLSRHLSALDVYVHTHAAGASGRSTTLMSALAHGLPVVAYDGPETAPPFAGGGVALAPGGDVEALAGCVAMLLDAPAVRGHAGARARGLYARNFAWDIIARKLEEAVS
jgi:glycosyltransferase involved in cell wall biosynthesis